MKKLQTSPIACYIPASGAELKVVVGELSAFELLTKTTCIAREKGNCVIVLGETEIRGVMMTRRNIKYEEL